MSENEHDYYSENEPDEQILEECNLAEINSFCENSLKEEMLNDIKEGYYE